MSDRRRGHGRRKADRWMPKVLPTYIAVVVTLLIAVTAYAGQHSANRFVKQMRSVQAGACLRANRSDEILRTLVNQALANYRAVLPEPQRSRTIALYSRELRALSPKSCPTVLGPIIKETNDRVDAALYAECQRVNLLRTQANRNSTVQFYSAISGWQRERALAKAGGPDAHLHRRSARQILAFAKQLRHTHLTDCHAAIYTPDRYKPPQPQPFPVPR